MITNNYYEVMKIFLNGYFREFHGRGIFGNTGLSQKTISRILIELEGKKILVSKKVGNLKYYSLNFLNPLIKDYIILFESFRKVDFLEKNKKMIDFLKELKADIVCVFGSYASGKNNKKSDLDLYVVGKVNTIEIKKKGEEYGFEVQVFNVSLLDFRKFISAKNPLFMEVLLNHVIMKGKELFVEEVFKWSK